MRIEVKKSIVERIREEFNRLTAIGKEPERIMVTRDEYALLKCTPLSGPGQPLGFELDRGTDGKMAWAGVPIGVED